MNQYEEYQAARRLRLKKTRNGTGYQGDVPSSGMLAPHAPYAILKLSASRMELDVS